MRTAFFLLMLSVVMAGSSAKGQEASANAPATSPATAPSTSVMPAWGPVEDLPVQVKHLTAQIQEARARITSLTYRAVNEGEGVFGDRGIRRYSSQLEVLEKDGLRATARSSSMTFLNGRTPPQENATRAVRGLTYCAHRWKSAGAADQYLYESPKNMSEVASAEDRGFNGLSILSYGFGDGDNQFDARYLQDPTLSRWEVSEVHKATGRVEYHLSRFAVKEGGAHPQSTWVFDSEQGNLITHVTWYGPAGQAWKEVSVRCAEVGKGVFLPWQVEVKEFAGRLDAASVQRMGLKSADDASSTNRLSFSDVKVNVDVPDERFTMAFLDLPDGAIVQQRQLDGRIRTMAYAANQVVDLDGATKLMPTKDPGKREGGTRPGLPK